MRARAIFLLEGTALSLAQQAKRYGIPMNGASAAAP
jgi:hypothetical protein